MLSSRDLRAKFLEFFQEKKHKLVPSASLLPKDDPTVLFTTAGMQQFVPYLMGTAHADGKRLCSVQKCVRTVDIEEVGDNRHLTFFEMLGNWSLGDYFKKEAIAWSYEFLTQHLQIDSEKLWTTVFAGDADVELDEESMKIWQEVGIPKERIVPIGPKKGSRKNRGDNFWGPAGKSGPCGPSTEMFLYIGKEKLKKNQTPATDEENFIEVWNDVFMEYLQDEDGKLTKLSQQNVDTGMGLERMIMTLNGNATVFETDIFAHIFAAIEKLSGQKYPPYSGDNDEKNPVTRAMRVVADHTRTITHIIADGGAPSNEGQGYVLRRLIRRAVRFGRSLGISKPFLSGLAKTHIAHFAEFYPELKARADVIQNTITLEEEKFLETLERGEKMLLEILGKKPEKISGAEAFKLFDTYGFPLDITKDMAKEHGISVDEEGFAAEMKQQKERARGARGDFFERGKSDYSAFEKLATTEFVGYEQDECTAKILHLQGLKKEGASHLMVEFALDKTPFYAESGGQIADTGKVSSNGNVIKVLDVQKLGNGVFVHTGEIIQGEPKSGENVTVAIDTERRNELRRHHSVTHLLHAALKKVLGKHVEQQGSLVTTDRTRFDFSHPKAVSSIELRAVEKQIASWVSGSYPVKIEEMALEKAKAAGAEALFSEKYGKTVRTIKMGEVSFELCGGTHVGNTSEIGAIKIVKESGIASGVRRIELVCGLSAQTLFWNESDELISIAEKLKVPEDKIGERLAAVFAERKELENRLKENEAVLIRFEADPLFEMQIEAHGKKIVCEPLPTGDTKKIGALARELIQRGVDIAAIFTRDGSVAIATKANSSAKDILEKIIAFAGGEGGGGPSFAQGAKVNLEEFREIRKIVAAQ